MVPSNAYSLAYSPSHTVHVNSVQGARPSLGDNWGSRSHLTMLPALLGILWSACIRFSAVFGLSS